MSNTFTTFALRPLVSADKLKGKNSPNQFDLLKQELAEAQEAEKLRKAEKRRLKKLNAEKESNQEPETVEQSEIQEEKSPEENIAEEKKLNDAETDAKPSEKNTTGPIKLPVINEDKKLPIPPVLPQPKPLPQQHYDEVFIDPLVQWVLNGRRDDVDMAKDMVVLPGSQPHPDVIRHLQKSYHPGSYPATMSKPLNSRNSSVAKSTQNLNFSQLPAITQSDNPPRSNSFNDSRFGQVPMEFASIDQDSQFQNWVLNGID